MEYRILGDTDVCLLCEALLTVVYKHAVFT
jgi:hypothetical protein